MHYSAYVNAEKFYEKYCKIGIENKKTLEENLKKAKKLNIECKTNFQL